MRTIGYVDSVSEFLDRARHVSKGWNDWSDAEEWVCWFRGEPDASSKTALRPRVYRQANTRITKALDREQELRIEFKRCAAQLVSGFRPTDKWEWYFTMQHYGVPTRLLDWTDSALVALFFALEPRDTPSDRYGQSDAVVYALDPRWLNHLTFRRLRTVWEGVALPNWPAANKYLSDDEIENREKLRVKQPLAIDPTHLFGRVAAQRSRFVIFGRERDQLWDLSKKRNQPRIACFKVRQKRIRQMKEDLRLAGLTRSSIFPDLDGLGRELADWFDRQHHEGR